MPVKLVHANIKSREEAYLRLIQGEVFWLAGTKIFYDKEHFGIPFRVENNGCRSGLLYGINSCEVWEKEVVSW